MRTARSFPSGSPTPFTTSRGLLRSSIHGDPQRRRHHPNDVPVERRGHIGGRAEFGPQVLRAVRVDLFEGKSTVFKLDVVQTSAVIDKTSASTRTNIGTNGYGQMIHYVDTTSDPDNGPHARGHDGGHGLQRPRSNASQTSSAVSIMAPAPSRYPTQRWSINTIPARDVCWARVLWNLHLHGFGGLDGHEPRRVGRHLGVESADHWGNPPVLRRFQRPNPAVLRGLHQQQRELDENVEPTAGRRRSIFTTDQGRMTGATSAGQTVTRDGFDTSP